jgi:hypothetical protein
MLTYTQEFNIKVIVRFGVLAAVAEEYCRLRCEDVFSGRKFTYVSEGKIISIIRADLLRLPFCLPFLILFILVRHTRKLNYRIIVNTVQCDSICRYLLPLHVSVS